MSISLNANFELLSSGLYLDARQQFNTIIEMRDFAETSIPDGFITYNKETQKHYVFSSSNTVDATLGKWREYNGEGGSSDGIDELTKEDVERLLGLTKEEIEAMTDLILDTEVRIDKTYSSSKIYTDIQQCLEDSKTYTLEELGKFSGVSYKIVASTSEMTSESIIYLLANGNTYDMYVVEENGATTKIGDTNVNLSDYYTKTEIDNDFLKKVDADGKYATITTVDAEIAKVETELKGNIKEINDSLVDIESALDELENITRLTDFDEAIPEKGKNKIYYVNKLIDTYTCAQWRVESMYYDVSGAKQYRGVQKATSINGVDTIMLMREYYLDNNVIRWSDWTEFATMDKLNYSTVADVSKTLTPLFPSVVKVASGGVTINYIVRNGWCNVNFKFNITSSTTFSWTDIAWGLPIPANSVDTVLMSDGKAMQPIPIKITSTGSVSSKVLSAISTTDWWTGNISYPVAE